MQLKKIFFIAVSLVVFKVCASAQQSNSSTIHIAPAPLFRDPITDGAADPVIVWNREEKSWWMLYTQRRANTEAPDVAYCYGTKIGIASTKDHRQTWVYRGTLDLEFEKGLNTLWAPDIVYNDGLYHMFVVYIQGARIHWGGKARMAHYTSRNLWDWKFNSFLKLSSENVIDASLLQMPGGTWRMWYKDDANNATIMLAESKDLYNWSLVDKPVISGSRQEGPKIFKYADWYWMITDEWHGMRVYKSKDCSTWEKQGLILDSASARPEDKPSGAHGDVIVVDGRAYIFYFTHPGRKTHGDAPADENGIIPFNLRRSSIQAAQLEFTNGTLICDRSKPFNFWLPDPEK